VQTSIIGQDSDILHVLGNSVHVLAGTGEMSDLTACGMNSEINWIWQWKAWVGTFERDGVFFARVKVRFFRDANGISVFLTLLPLRRRRTLRLSAAEGNSNFRISLTIASNHNCNLSNQAGMVMTLSRPRIVVPLVPFGFSGRSRNQSVS
jgi:hypothetical protein